MPLKPRYWLECLEFLFLPTCSPLWDSEHLFLVWASNLEWNRLRFCSSENFNFVRIGEKTAYIPKCLAITLCNLSWYCSDYSWLCHWCSCETTAVGNSGFCELGSLLMTSLLWAPSKQHSSQECVRGTPLYLSQESPCCCHPSRSRGCVGCYRADGAAWLSSSMSPDAMGLFSLQSREEVLQGHDRLQGKFLSPADSCSCKLPFFCILPLCVLCVLEVELFDGWPWAVGPLQAELSNSALSCCTHFSQPGAIQSSKRSVVLLWLIVTVVIKRLHITVSYHEGNPILI